MKKALVLFDLQNTLLQAKRQSRLKKHSFGEKVKPDLVKDKFEYFFRPGRTELLDYFFLKEKEFFDVGVWSSCDKDTTQQLSQIYFERYYRNLLFVVGSRRPEYELSGKQPEAQWDQPSMAISRDLNVLTSKFPEYELNNMVVVSSHANSLKQFRPNDIQTQPMELREDDFTIQATVKYLNGVRIFVQREQVQDLRPILNTKSLAMLQERLVKSKMGYNEYM